MCNYIIFPSSPFSLSLVLKFLIYSHSFIVVVRYSVIHRYVVQTSASKSCFLFLFSVFFIEVLRFMSLASILFLFFLQQTCYFSRSLISMSCLIYVILFSLPLNCHKFSLVLCSSSFSCLAIHFSSCTLSCFGTFSNPCWTFSSHFLFSVLSLCFLCFVLACSRISSLLLS